MAKSKDFLKKEKGYSDDNVEIISTVLRKKFGEYIEENEKSNTLFVIPNISSGMVYGVICEALSPYQIYQSIIDLHVAVVDYEEGSIIRLYDR